MQLAAAFTRLPIRFDAERLAAEIEALPESAWRPHPEGHPGNSALPLVARGGDPADDGVRGPMGATPVLASLPYVRQVLAAMGAPIGRTRLMRLDGDAEATRHADVNYYWLNHVRVHVPVVTTPEVRFACGRVETHMRAGETWVFDTWRMHNVHNPAPTRRIHLVIDTVGSASFWDLVDRGEDADGDLPPSTAPMAAFDPDADPAIELEVFNHPDVMSPWELAALTDWLVEDSHASDVARRAIRALQRDWRARWTQHGDAAGARGGYRELLGATASILGGTDDVVSNGTRLAAAFEHAVGSVAVAETDVEPASTARRSRLAPPTFIVSAPRSGSSLLFETLGRSPDLWSIGAESHDVIEGIPALHPSTHGWESNRLTAADVTPAVVDALVERFDARLRDRRGARPADHLRGLRLLEKTPKNALRIPFLAAAFPHARFVYLYRDPVDTMASMLEGWRSGQFVTYPGLPGWEGAHKWSFLLVPGWRELVGLPLREVVARQWATATTMLLDDLEALDPERWSVAAYGRLLSDPQAEIVRLCRFLGVRWDQQLEGPLPLSKTTLTAPDAGKSARNGRELESVLPLVADVSDRARQVFAEPPGRARAGQARRARPAPAVQVVQPPGDGGFGSAHTEGFVEILTRLGASLVVSTYQSGRVIAMRADEGALNTHFRRFDNPMGLAVRPGRLLVGTRSAVWEYRNHAGLAPKLEPAGKHDACYLPSRCTITGDIRIHDVEVAGGETWVVNTAFSCLATLDDAHSFVPRWRPSWVTALTPEDRCHLNGMAVVDDRPKYVTAFGQTDTVGGWRAEKAFGGVIVDVDSGDVIADHLCMPHSPRWHDGQLWVLESGKGTLATVDVATGELSVVAELPGFTRGLTFAGPFAFVGLSLVRESLFDGVPIVGRDDLACGVWVVDTRSGESAFVRFSGIVQEIFDVQLLPYRFPEIAEPGDRQVASSFVLPDDALADVPPR
jgi:uncharacterized protein (TIGR03032 family)